MDKVRVIFEGLGLHFDIDNVAFTLHLGNDTEFSVYWYGILIALGFLLAVIFAIRKAKIFGIDYDRMIDVVIVGIIGGIVGARLYFVAFNLSDYKSFSDIIDIHNGGLAIYGGIIGALLLGGIMCRIRKVKILPMFDIAAIGLFLGQAIGRWGNFINQEAFGTNTTLPWGMYSSETNAYLAANKVELARLGVTVDPTQPVHPCFLYESIICLAGFFFLWWMIRRRKFDGQIFLTYLVIYGTARFFIEGIRTDSLLVGNVRVSQVLSAFVALSALLAIIYKFVFTKCTLYADTDECREMLSRLDKSALTEEIGDEYGAIADELEAGQNAVQEPEKQEPEKQEPEKQEPEKQEPEKKTEQGEEHIGSDN